MKLTKRVIDTASYQGESNARYVLWDKDVPGFGGLIWNGPGMPRRVVLKTNGASTSIYYLRGEA